MKCTSPNDCATKSPLSKCKATIKGYCPHQEEEKPLEEGYYWLKKITVTNKRPSLVYLKKLGVRWCFGFNAYDGGSFLPLDEITDDTLILPATVSAP